MLEFVTVEPLESVARRAAAPGLSILEPTKDSQKMRELIAERPGCYVSMLPWAWAWVVCLVRTI